MNYIPAKYTEVLYNLLNNDETKALIDSAMSTYPIYTPTSKNEYIPNIIPTREELNKKILNYYKYREIGFETVARFADELETALCEIMPYYNQLFLTQDQDFNIIYNVDYVRNIDTTRTGESKDAETEDVERTTNAQTTTDTQSDTSTTDRSTTTSAAESNTKRVRSDTPQDQLSITNRNIDAVNYANEAEWNKDNSTSSGESTGTGTGSTTSTGKSGTTGTESGKVQRGRENKTEGKDSTTETTKGNYGVVSAQDLILKFRETIINTVQMIINDPRITELFMFVY